MDNNPYADLARRVCAAYSGKRREPRVSWLALLMVALLLLAIEAVIVYGKLGCG